MTERVDAVQPIVVKPWPSEMPLLLVAVLCSLAVWIVALVSIIGAFYAVALGLFFFLTHLTFVAHVRGSAVRIGPDQFPELHQSVDRISRAMGLVPAPEAYVMQAGGALNALATRFLRSDMVVLYADLLEACEDDPAARDMIVGHELGHLRAGHLRLLWLILPAWLVPFLGPALSRAREYTADRYGLAAAGDPAGAALGLTILAAGPSHGRHVNHDAFLRQRESLNTGWMTLGGWLASHPPLARRLAALGGNAPEVPFASRGRVRALGILGLVMMPFVVGGCVAALMLPAFVRALESAERQRPGGFGAAALGDAQRSSPSPVAGRRQAIADMTALAAFIEQERRDGFAIPWDGGELSERWAAAHGGKQPPADPFDEGDYGYRVHGQDYLLWSAGPDGDGYTADDLVFDSRTGQLRTWRDRIRPTAQAIAGER